MLFNQLAPIDRNLQNESLLITMGQELQIDFNIRPHY